MKKVLTGTKSLATFHCVTSFVHEHHTVKELSYGRPTIVNDFVVVHNQKIQLPHNTSIKQINLSWLDELVESDDTSEVDFAVNMKYDFEEKMKLPRKQLSELKDRLKRIDQVANRSISQLTEISHQSSYQMVHFRLAE